MLLCSLYPISLPSHFVQFSACDLCFDGYTNLVSLPSGVCNLVGEVGPEVCALIPLIWALIGLRWPELDLDIEGIFPIPLWFSVSSLWWYLLPAWWNRAPDLFLSCFWSVVRGWWDWGTPTGREATEYFSSQNILHGVCSVCHLSCSSKLLCDPIIGIALGPTLSMGHPVYLIHM